MNVTIRVTALCALLLAALPVGANKGRDARANDIAAHRAIAQAHAEAAQCLEAGKPEQACHATLAAACKGLAIGAYCGMRHRH